MKCHTISFHITSFISCMSRIAYLSEWKFLSSSVCPKSLRFGRIWLRKKRVL
jgi:hypothetical protein